MPKSGWGINPLLPLGLRFLRPRVINPVVFPPHMIQIFSTRPAVQQCPTLVVYASLSSNLDENLMSLQLYQIQIGLNSSLLLCKGVLTENFNHRMLYRILFLKQFNCNFYKHIVIDTCRMYVLRFVHKGCTILFRTPY